MSTPCGTPGCPHITFDTAAVCRECLRRYRDLLDQVPALYGELRHTYARLDNFGPTAGMARGNSSAPLPYKPHAREALEILSNVVLTWARTLVQCGGPTPRTGRDANPVRYLAANLPALARHPQAGQAVDELTDAVALGWRTVDRPAETLLVGACEATTVDGPCPQRLYAHPGDVITICPVCGATRYVESRRRVMLNAAKELEVTQTIALGWVRLLTDRHIPPGTFRSWISRRRLTPTGHNTAGQPLYRFGDVHTLAERPHTTARVA